MSDDVVDRLLAAIQDGDVEAVTAMFAPGAVLELSPGARRWTGRSEIASALATLGLAFAGLTWAGIHRSVEFSRVIEEGVWEGVNVGPLPGWMASGTGKPVRLRARALVETGPAGVRRLRFSTDLSGLQFALGLTDRPDAAAFVGSQVSSLTSQRALRIQQADGPPSAALGRSLGGAAGGAGRLPSVVGLTRSVIGLVFSLAVAGLLFIGWTALGGSSLGFAKLGTSKQSGGSSPAGAALPSTLSSLSGLSGESGQATPSDPAAAPRPGSGVTQHGRDLDVSTDVLFHTDSSVLTPSARGAIREVARLLQARGVSAPVLVNGYTDDVASSGYNLRLSRRRAQAVVTALQGLLGTRAPPLTAHGYGETHPVATNATAAGRAHNRRVTIVLPKDAHPTS